MHKLLREPSVVRLELADIIGDGPELTGMRMQELMLDAAINLPRSSGGQPHNGDNRQRVEEDSPATGDRAALGRQG
jgi:hypothetical protein